MSVSDYTSPKPKQSFIAEYSRSCVPLNMFTWQGSTSVNVHVDAVGLHLHTLLQSCLNSTFIAHGSPRGGTVAEPVIKWAKSFKVTPCSPSSKIKKTVTEIATLFMNSESVKKALVMNGLRL